MRPIMLLLILGLGLSSPSAAPAQTGGGSPGGSATVWKSDGYPFSTRQSEMVAVVKEVVSGVLELCSALALGYALVVGLLLEFNALVGAVNSQMRVRLWVGVGVMAMASVLAQFFMRLTPGSSPGG